MKPNLIPQLQTFFKENNIPVSELEYTKNNIDDNGNLIKEKIPTITTNYCEIGIHNNSIYFVFILHSETVTEDFFNTIKDDHHMQIYGFKDCKTTLYPKKDFDLHQFLEGIGQEPYLQIQYTFQNIDTIDIYKEYIQLLKIFTSNIKVVNQLEIDLTKNY